MRVETLTPVVASAPGARARWRLRIENDSAVPMGYRLRVIGFDPANVLQPPPSGPLDAGSSDVIDLELLIPEAFAAGHHSIATEVTPDRPGIAPVIAGVTVTVGTIDDLALAVVPSTIRARRRATFRLDIDNRSNEERELELEGDSAELEIRMRPDRVLLQPGERVRTSGRIKGPRHLVGEPRQHSLTVAARSRSAPAYAPATFQQRALFPRGLRTMLAVLLIVGIWGGALGAGFLWWQSRDDEAAPAELVDIDGDGREETPGDELIDTNGDGEGDTAASIVAARVAAAADAEPPQPGGSDVPTRTSMGGTVAADGGQAPGVDVTLTPIDVGAPPPEGATVLGFRNGELRELDGPPTAAKFWPARFGRYQPDVRSGYRQTEAVADLTSTDERGVWFFGSVSVGQSYEVSFSRPGFDTQSFVITPSADGKPIDLPVEMQPAEGIIRGTVRVRGAGLGNVKLELTDGTLVFNSASASEGEVGTYSFTGVSTPGTYTLRATARGLGTEVVQVTLEEGEERGGVDINMSAGVGTISGRVTEGGQPLGGVTLTASNGDTTVTTTSLTEGATGTYLFPRLEIPGRWTIQAELDGYVTQTRLVELNGNATGIDFAFVKRTGSIIGLVASSNGGPLPGVNIRVSRDDLAFETQSAVSPDPGSFNVRDLPPGTYLVELSRFDHEPTSQSVTIGPGQVADLGTLTLVFRPRPDITQNGGLEVRVVNSEGNPITPSRTAPGATVRVLRAADDSLAAEQVGTPDQSSFFFQPLPIGTYRIEVTRGVTYRLATRRTSVGLANVVEVIPIYLLGQVHGRLIDSFTRAELIDYDVQIRRINPDGTESIVQNLPVTAATPLKAMPDGSLQRRFETANPPGLTSGNYRVVVDNPPPGYRIRPDQVLQPGQPPMRFVIRPDNDVPIDVGSILADRFPEIHGVVRVPRLGAAPTPGDPRPISFVPVDDDSLALTLTCPGLDPTDAPSVFELPEAVPPGPRPYAGSEITDEIPDPAAGSETFYIDPVDIEELDVFGACRMEVRVAGYTTKTFDVFIDAIRGQHSRIDRNVGLVRPRDIAGTAFWVDDGPTTDREVEAAGVPVRLQGDTVTGLNPGSVPFGTAGSEPTPVLEDVAEVVTDAVGGWVFPGSAVAPPPNADPAVTVLVPRQVFGEALYSFDLPAQYEARSVRLTVDENGKTATEVVPIPEPFPLETSLTGDRIQLDAIGADVTARLDIRTVKGSPGLPGVDLAGFTAALTGANGVPGVVPTVSGGNSTTQRLQATTVGFGVTPDPGTHQWTVTPPATPADGRPRFKPATPEDLAPSATFFQAPATALSPETTPELVKTFVEMGSMRVQVVRPISAGGGSVSEAVVSLSSALMTVSPVTGADNVVGGLDVALDPGGSTNYTVTMTQAANPTLDVAKATAQVFNDNGAFLGNCSPGVSTCTVNVPQGGQPRIRITVPRFGRFIGTVCGTTSNAGPFPATCAAPNEQLEIDGVPPLLVTATRIAVPRPGDPRFCDAVSGPTVTAIASATGSFEFFGEPGYYRVTVSHPDHELIPGEFIAQQPVDLQCLDFANPIFPPFPLPPIPTFPPLYAGQPVYQLQNDVVRDRSLDVPTDPTNDDPWFLVRLRSDVTVSVRDDTLLPTQGPATPAADVSITPAGGTEISCEPVPDPDPTTPTQCVTDGAGRFVLAGDRALLPGVYALRVDKTGYFPLILTIEIRRGGGAVTINVPLPRVGGSITGSVVARNSEGDALPAPVGVVVSNQYDQPDAVVTGATVLTNNTAPVGAGTASAGPTAPPGLTQVYSFTGLGSGVHRLSYAFDNTAGVFTNVPPAVVPVTVLSPAVTTAPNAVYTAANRDVVVVVRPASATTNVDGALVSLIDPDSPGAAGPAVPVGACPVTTPPIPANRRCATFPDLPPEIPSYRVLVSKDLFATADVPFTVEAGASDLVVQVELALAGNAARVVGTAIQVEDGASPPATNAVPPGTTVQLIELPATIDATTATGSGGSFRFDITEPGSYAIEAVGVDGYASRRTPVTITAADLGTTLAPIVVNVEKFATFNISVGGTGLDTGTVAGVGLPTGAGAPAMLAPVSSGGGDFTFEGDPAWSYRFRFTSTQGYAAVTTPATTDPAIEPAVGAEETLTVTMSPRTISGAVAGGTGGTVRLVGPGTTVAAGPVTIDADGNYALPGPIVAGPYTLVAELLGTGRGTPPVTVALTDGNLTGQDITLGARDVTISFTKTPAGALVTITAPGGPPITGTGASLPVPENRFPISYVVSSPGFISSAAVSREITTVNEAAADQWNAPVLTMTAAPVTLTSRTISGSVTGTTGATVRARTGTATVVGNVATGAGGFALTGPFPPGTYAIVAEELGRGRIAPPVTVADDAAPNPPDQTLTLLPRDVDITFTSTPAGASIVIDPAVGADISGTAGTPIPVPENAFPISYVANSPGYVPSSPVSVSLAPAQAGAANRWNLETLTQAVTVPALSPRAISGTFSGATDGTVRALVDTTVVAGPVDISATGTFTLPGPFVAGTYNLVAEQLGVGRGTLGPITIANESAGNVTGQIITPLVRNVLVTFPLNPPPPSATVTVTVTPPGPTPLTGSTGPAGAVPVPENLFPITYTVSAPGFVPSAPQTRVITDVAENASPTRWDLTALTMTAPPTTLTPV